MRLKYVNVLSYIISIFQSDFKFFSGKSPSFIHIEIIAKGVIFSCRLKCCNILFIGSSCGYNQSQTLQTHFSFAANNIF
jgi:hypothetical protein